MLTPAAIAADLAGEVGRGLDLLQTDGQDLPDRQRSMRAVFDRSWGLLADRERQMLAGLSVFRGSYFTLEAARQVTGASLRELRALMDRSLLQRAAGGRYTIHELLRQYAGEKLAEAPGAAQSARDRHSACFAAAVARWWVDFQGPRHQLALAEMGAESGNLHTAWGWAAERGRSPDSARRWTDCAIATIGWGDTKRGRASAGGQIEGFTGMGERRREERADPSKVPPADPAERERVLARALAWQGVFCRRLGRRQQAWESLHRSLRLVG